MGIPNHVRNAHVLAAIIMAAILACSSLSCKHKGTKSDGAGDVLIAIGDSTLTLSDVVSRIPSGLEPADSANLFSSIVDAWIENMLLSEYARENITDIDEIERQVQEFRNALIIGRYKRMMREKNASTPSDNRVSDYYEKHGSHMMLEAPIIKGIYIRIPNDAEAKEDVRHWVKSATSASVDRLEKYGLKGAMQYDYFMDRWVDFSLIADQIPTRISDPDDFVKTTTDFEIEANGSIYLLHISDRITSGEAMPRDYAEPRIREILSVRDREDVDTRLITNLYNKGVKEGRVKSPGYDMRTHSLKR